MKATFSGETRRILFPTILFFPPGGGAPPLSLLEAKDFPFPPSPPRMARWVVSHFFFSDSFGPFFANYGFLFFFCSHRGPLPRMEAPCLLSVGLGFLCRRRRSPFLVELRGRSPRPGHTSSPPCVCAFFSYGPPACDFPSSILGGVFSAGQQRSLSKDFPFSPYPWFFRGEEHYSPPPVPPESLFFWRRRLFSNE